MRKFGLLGKNISYSFSKGYFAEKFKKEMIENASYENFDISTINQLENIRNANPSLKGLNVTIPYKEAVIPYLYRLNKEAKAIGAVNTIKVTKTGRLTGYNTDFYGFRETLRPLLKQYHKNALILGTGGASKAIAYALEQLNINYAFVSRVKTENQYSYEELDTYIIKSHQIIINCTPLGTHPNVKDCPTIPYKAVTHQHILYDLIYNPSKTVFLQQGEKKGATIFNGLKMLELQAEKAWEIWNS